MEYDKDFGMFIVGLLCGHWHLIFQINIGYVWKLDNYLYCCNYKAAQII